jgi:hypothetical protein
MNRYVAKVAAKIQNAWITSRSRQAIKMGRYKKSPFTKKGFASSNSFLFGFDCIHRTNICTRTTVRTNVRVNHIDITFGNRFHRALVNASPASCAVICDFIGHCYLVFIV